MFGFQGGERADTVARKREYMKDAQRHWNFLTYFDLSTIRNEGQLTAMVRERAGLPADQAKRDVQAWMLGKRFFEMEPQVVAGPGAQPLSAASSR